MVWWQQHEELLYHLFNMHNLNWYHILQFTTFELILLTFFEPLSYHLHRLRFFIRLLIRWGILVVVVVEAKLRVFMGVGGSPSILAFVAVTLYTFWLRIFLPRSLPFDVLYVPKFIVNLLYIHYLIKYHNILIVFFRGMVNMILIFLGNKCW